MNTRERLTFGMFLFSVCATTALILIDREKQVQTMDPAVLFDTVNVQVKAFRASNFPSAYNQVSKGFQKHFSLEDFVERVRHDYSRIQDAERVEFGPWFHRGSRATLQVFFVYNNGTVSPCLYTLVREGETWKIEGARWVKGWSTGQRMRGVQS